MKNEASKSGDLGSNDEILELQEHIARLKLATSDIVSIQRSMHDEIEQQSKIASSVQDWLENSKEGIEKLIDLDLSHSSLQNSRGHSQSDFQSSKENHGVTKPSVSRSHHSGPAYLSFEEELDQINDFREEIRIASDVKDHVMLNVMDTMNIKDVSSWHQEQSYSQHRSIDIDHTAVNSFLRNDSTASNRSDIDSDRHLKVNSFLGNASITSEGGVRVNLKRRDEDDIIDSVHSLLNSCSEVNARNILSFLSLVMYELSHCDLDCQKKRAEILAYVRSMSKDKQMTVNSSPEKLYTDKSPSKGHVRIRNPKAAPREAGASNKKSTSKRMGSRNKSTGNQQNRASARNEKADSSSGSGGEYGDSPPSLSPSPKARKRNNVRKKVPFPLPRSHPKPSVISADAMPEQYEVDYEEEEVAILRKTSSEQVSSNSDKMMSEETEKAIITKGLLQKNNQSPSRPLKSQSRLLSFQGDMMADQLVGDPEEGIATLRQPSSSCLPSNAGEIMTEESTETDYGSEEEFLESFTRESTNKTTRSEITFS